MEGFLGEQYGKGGAEPHNERATAVVAESSGQGPAQTEEGHPRSHIDWLATKGVRAADQDQRPETYNWSTR